MNECVDGIQVNALVAGVRHDFVHQYDAWADVGEQRAELSAARGAARARGGPDDVVGGLTAQLPRHLAPQCVARIAVVVSSLVCWGQMVSVKHRYLGFDFCVGIYAGFGYYGADLFGDEIADDVAGGREQRAVFVDDVVNGDEAVRLAAAEAGARQYDGIAAVAGYALERVD